MKKLSVSVVVPVYNEYDNLDELYQQLKKVVPELSSQTASRASSSTTVEVIFVDDGSNDNSGEKIERLIKNDTKFKLISLSRNYGQTTSIAAGIKHSQGDVIVTLDADLQNDPEDITKLMEKIYQGADVACGWRKKRKDPYFSRRLPSSIANFFISFLTGVKLHDYGCTLKAYRKEFLQNLSIYGEMHRFLPAYCVWQGAKINELIVNHRPRLHGKSKYGLNRIFKVILDLLVVKFLLSYLTKPIYVFGGTSILSFLLGTAVIILVIIRKLFFAGQWISPLFFVGFSLWSLSVICLLLGLLSEVVVRLYFESRQYPTYRINKKTNV